MLDQRIAQHHQGAFPRCYTYERRPLKLVHASPFATAIEAISAEKQLKSWSHAKKRAFIRGDWGALRRASRVRVHDESNRLRHPERVEGPPSPTVPRDHGLPRGSMRDEGPS